MQNKQTHWSSILILITIGIGVVFVALIAFALFIRSIMDLVKGRGDAAGDMIGTASFGFIMLVLVTCFWFILQKTRRLPSADELFIFPYAQWQIFAVIGIFVVGIAFGVGISLTTIPWLSWLILPLLTVILIVAPIWLLFGIGSNKLDANPRWKFFAALGISLTIAPVIMTILEIVTLIVVVILIAIYFGITNPALLDHLRVMVPSLRTETNQDALLKMLTPYLTNPAVIGTGIGYVALIVPLIEEFFKPLGVWLFGKSMQTPAQGFALGLLGGAAFAMVESLNASTDGSTSWGVIVAVRAGTSILHMTSSGLVGWGIASALKEKRYGRFVAAYFAAVLIHGVWNACAAGTAIATLGEYIGRPEWLYNYILAFIVGLLTMGLSVILILIRSNKLLRNNPVVITKEEEKVESAA